jgi:protocatechuate 3,4-dioxygenase, beta subunit
MRLIPTASQTVGPFFNFGLTTNDPLIPLDPIANGIADDAARQRLVSAFDLSLTEPEWALGYRVDIVLRGRCATPFEEPRL